MTNVNSKNVDLDVLFQDVGPAVRKLTARPGIGLESFVNDPLWIEGFMALHGHEF